MKLIRWMAAFLLVVGVTAAALAANPKIYIRNQPYQGRSLQQDGQLWLPLEDYARAMGLHLSQDQNSFSLIDPARGARKSPTRGKGTSPALFVNGQRVEGALLEQDGTWWVAVRAATRVLGGYVTGGDDSAGVMEQWGRQVEGEDVVRISMPSAPARQSRLVMVHWHADW